MKKNKFQQKPVLGIKPKEQKQKPLTAAQIALMPPTPFSDAVSYMRDKRQNIIKNPATGEPINKRPKREWSFEGVHQVYFEDGTFEERPGRYVVKQVRQ